MTDIPEDVMKAAEQTLDNVLCHDKESCGGYQEMRNASIKEIALAILAERVSKWQPIETAPKDGTAVNIWGANKLHPRQTGRRSTNVTWGRVRDWMGRERDDWQHGQGEDFEPTHWMPRPTAPPEAS